MRLLLTKQTALPAFARSAAVALCLLALTGCDGQKGTTPASPPTAAMGAGGTVVHLAFFPNVTHAAALVGTARGTFAEAVKPLGATLDEKTFTAGPSEIEALFAGAVDVGFIGPGPAVNGYLKSGGKALRIVAGAASGGAGLIVRNDAGIKTLADLAGKRVAIPQVGGTQDVSLRHALAEAHLASKDKGGTVDIVQYAPADVAALMARKELDAAWLPEPWLSTLEKAGNTILFDERTRWPGGKFATTVVVVRAEFADAHPDLVEKLLEAHIDTVTWIAAHKDEARFVVGKRIETLTHKALPDDVLKAALARTEITYDPLKPSVLTFAEWAKTAGYQRGDGAPLDALFAPDALNNALKARKLAALPSTTK